MYFSYECKRSEIFLATRYLHFTVIMNFYSAFTETGATQTMKKVQSDGKTEITDSNIFKSSQSNIRNKIMTTFGVYQFSYIELTLSFLIGRKHAVKISSCDVI